MTPRPGQVLPSAEPHAGHGLRMVPWIVVTFILLDAVSGIIERAHDLPDAGPAGLVAAGQKLVTVAAAAVVVWHRPRIAVALTALVAVLALTASPTGEELWLVLVVGVTAAVRYRPRRLGLVLAGEVGWAVAVGVEMEHVQQGWGRDATLVYLAAAGVALAVGLVARRLLQLRDRRRRQVAQLERERAEIRTVERARLADELQALVSQGLVGMERELADVGRRRPDLAGLHASLALVDEHSRSLLGQLGALLTVLRDDQAEAGPAPAPQRRRARPAFLSLPASSLVAATAALVAAGVLLVLVRSGTTPYWYSLPIWLLCLLATAILGTRGIWAVVLGVAGFSSVLVQTDPSAAVDHVVLLGYGAFLGTTAGLVTRHFVVTRRDAVRQLGELSHELTQVESEERGTAARELHDVVAHQLSLTSMLVMASSLSEDPDELISTLGQIRGTTTAAHDELTALVAGMRGRTPDERPVRVVSPVGCAEALASRLRESGFQPVLAIDPVADALEPTTRQTLARIMQEATTNIVRYAPGSSRCDYALGVDGPEVTLTVASPVTAGGRRSDQSLGWGLRGAQERVELTNGTFRAGQEGNRWVVTVTLPTHVGGGHVGPGLTAADAATPSIVSR